VAVEAAEPKRRVLTARRHLVRRRDQSGDDAQVHQQIINVAAAEDTAKCGHRQQLRRQLLAILRVGPLARRGAVEDVLAQFRLALGS
jgi:hypothetical protein